MHFQQPQMFLAAIQAKKCGVITKTEQNAKQEDIKVIEDYISISTIQMPKWVKGMSGRVSGCIVFNAQLKR